VGTGHKTVNGNIRLQGPGRAHTDNLQAAGLWPHFPRFHVYIDQGVHFIQGDIDVIGANAGGDDADPFFPDPPGMRDEFTVLVPEFDFVKMPADLLDTVRIAHRNHRIREFFGPQVEVVNGSPFVEDEFGRADFLHLEWIGLNEWIYA
jgi:hypothetical protein